MDRAEGLIFDYLAKVRSEVMPPDGEKTTALRGELAEKPLPGLNKGLKASRRGMIGGEEEID